VLRTVPGAVPIPGTTKPGRVDENVGALDVELTGDDLAALDAVFPPGVAAGERYPAPMMSVLDG
jgi:aryl-alcohol dehydrogenase-like predicted oxidoreductase